MSLNFDLIKIIVTAASATINAGNLYAKIRINEKLSESEVDEYLEPIYSDLLKVKKALVNMNVSSMNINLASKTESLKAPKFIKENKETLLKIQNDIENLVKKYDAVANVCVGILNEKLAQESILLNVSRDELDEIPREMVDYILNYKNNTQVSQLCNKIEDKLLNKNKLENREYANDLDFHKKIDIAINNTLNEIWDKDNFDNSFTKSITKLFQNEVNSQSEREIRLQEYLKSFLEFSSFAYKEIEQNIEDIDRYYEKSKPKK